MTWIRFSLSLVLIVAATVSTALVQGQMRNRWGAAESARKAAALMQEFPRNFGDWHMTSAGELDEDSQSQLQSLVGMVRVYKNARTAEQVNLLFILGPMGPTAVHTPEVCMSQREFAPQGDRREVTLGQRGDQFWNKRFKSKTVHGECQSLYWAWNAHGKWIASKDARYEFAGNPYLYKVQVATWLHGPAANESDHSDINGDRPDDAGARFLADFVSVAAKHLVQDLKE